MHFKITKMMDINIGYLYNLNAHFNIGFFFFLEMKSTWKLRSQIFSLAGSIQLKKKRLVYHFLFCFFHSKNKRLWSSFSLKKCRWLVPCERVVLIYRKQHTTFVTCHHGIVVVQQWFYYALYIMDCASRVDQIPCLFFLNVPFRHNSPCISSS